MCEAGDDPRAIPDEVTPVTPVMTPEPTNNKSLPKMTTEVKRARNGKKVKLVLKQPRAPLRTPEDDELAEVQVRGSERESNGEHDTTKTQCGRKKKAKSGTQHWVTSSHRT